jgi:hypothetical protein
MIFRPNWILNIIENKWFESTSLQGVEKSLWLWLLLQLNNLTRRHDPDLLQRLSHIKMLKI